MSLLQTSFEASWIPCSGPKVKRTSQSNFITKCISFGFLIMRISLLVSEIRLDNIFGLLWVPLVWSWGKNTKAISHLCQKEFMRLFNNENQTTSLQDMNWTRFEVQWPAQLLLTLPGQVLDPEELEESEKSGQKNVQTKYMWPVEGESYTAVFISDWYKTK